MGSSAADELLDQFRQALDGCRTLYHASATQCAQSHRHLIKGDPERFLRTMDDLHSGLVVKIYTTVAGADRRWTEAEKRLAGALIEHVWRKPLAGDDLRETVRNLASQADKLKWRSLFRPFERIAPLRERAGELETVVMRMANLVAKADGSVSAQERQQLESIQTEIDRGLHRIPVDENRNQQAAEETGSEAAQKIDADARKMRDQIDRARPGDSPLPTASAPSTSQTDALAAAQAELDQLIGLTNIKEEIRTLVNFLRVQEERGRAGLPKSTIGLHMVFQGNPGTGKTTVARLVGRILGAMGILKNGHVIETDRSGLVAEYAGQTGPKTNKRVDAALDGILFIDEAYSLVAERGDDPYGREALQALLKRMEDDRERLVVILAGYPEPMERLLQSNPGLSSRFNRTFHFADYTTVELALVFDLMCRKNHYQVPALTRAKLLLGFDWLVGRRDEHFGNGRLVRNTFENATRRLANRIVGVAPLTRKLLTKFEAEDVQLDDVPAEVWAELDRPDRSFEFRCPGCGKPRALRQEHLGRRVRCRACDTTFSADWGRPLAT